MDSFQPPAKTRLRKHDEEKTTQKAYCRLDEITAQTADYLSQQSKALLCRGCFRTRAQPNNIIIDHSPAHTPYSKAAADDLHHIIKNLQWLDSEAFSNHV